MGRRERSSVHFVVRRRREDISRLEWRGGSNGLVTRRPKKKLKGPTMGDAQLFGDVEVEDAAAGCAS
jgi:hypothetical protein